MMPRPRFSPEVNFGHILQAVVLALIIGGVCVTSYISLRGDIGQLRADLGFRSPRTNYASKRLSVRSNSVASTIATSKPRCAQRLRALSTLSAICALRSCKSRTGSRPSACSKDLLLSNDAPMLVRNLIVVGSDSDGVRYKSMRRGTRRSSSSARTDLASSPPRAEQAWRQCWDPAAVFTRNIGFRTRIPRASAVV
jgi:hypothetical protein